MSDHNSRLKSLIEEYANIAVEATRVYEDGEDYSIFEPWLNACVKGILELKNNS